MVDIVKLDPAKTYYEFKNTFHLSKHKVPFQLRKKKLEKYDGISLTFGTLG